MAEGTDGRVAVYIDFDNIVISRYNQLHVRGAFQADRVRHVDLEGGSATPQVVERIRQGVAGATSKSLPAACNEFSLYDDLPGVGADDDGEVNDGAPSLSSPATNSTRSEGASEPSADPVPLEPELPAPATEDEEDQSTAPAPGVGEPAAKMSPRVATRLLRRALELGHDKAGHDEWLHTSEVKQQIKRMDPAFHEKSLGYSSFTDFVKSRSSLAEVDKPSKGQKVRLRRVKS